MENWELGTENWELSMYTELHARSAFSFLEGACLPEELAAAAAEYGIGAVAIMDRDGVYGAPRFHAEAERRKIKAHIGTEITLKTDSPQRHRETEFINPNPGRFGVLLYTQEKARSA